MRGASGLMGSGTGPLTGAARLAARTTVMGALLLASAAATTAAQQVDGGAPSAPSTASAEGNACFQPRPMPACRSFWITEFGVQWFVSQPPGVNDKRRWLATWEVGWMRNRTSNDAVGGSVFVAANDNAFRSGVRARYRRWTGGETAVDVSPGLIVFQTDEPAVRQGDPVGVAGQVAQHLLGSPEGRLAVNHPDLAVETVEEIAKTKWIAQGFGLSRQAQPPFLMEVLEACEEFASKHSGQHPHR